MVQTHHLDVLRWRRRHYLLETRGRVSNGPITDEVWSGLAVQFALSRSVRDSAALLDAVQGGGIGEPYYIANPEASFLSEVTRRTDQLSIGLMINPLNGARTSPEIEKTVRAVAQSCEELGHRVVEIRPEIGISSDGFVHANAQFWTANTAACLDAVSATNGRPISAETLEPAVRLRFGTKIPAPWVNSFRVRCSP